MQADIIATKIRTFLSNHLGYGRLQRPLATDAFLQCRRIEIHVPSLGYLKGDFSQASIKGFGFEAIGISSPALGAPIWFGFDGPRPLDSHCLVKHYSYGFSHLGHAGFAKKLNDGIDYGRFGLVGHVGFLSNELAFKRIGKQIWPTQAS